MLGCCPRLESCSISATRSFKSSSRASSEGERERRRKKEGEEKGIRVRGGEERRGGEGNKIRMAITQQLPMCNS